MNPIIDAKKFCILHELSSHRLAAPPAEQLGKNCRFLQGQRTEAAAVRAMVTSIRTAKPTTVRVTNYRQDGRAFTNVLTLHPVHDSNSEYRYSIGILSDGGNAAEEGAALEKLRRVLREEAKRASYQAARLPAYTKASWDSPRPQGAELPHFDLAWHASEEPAFMRDDINFASRIDYQWPFKEWRRPSRPCRNPKAYGLPLQNWPLEGYTICSEANNREVCFGVI